MLDLISNIPFVSLFIKFMIASTVLMGTVWFLEKLRVINTPDLAELAWKLAIAGSFVALLPVADWMSPVVIEDNRTAAFIDDLNSSRPLSELAPERKDTPAPLTITIDSSSRGALLDAQRAIEAAQARLSTTTGPAEFEEAAPAENQIEYSYGNNTLALESIDAKETEPASNPANPSAAETDNAHSLTPEFDSESNNQNTFWYSAAGLRTKDLAALGWVALALLTVGTLMLSYRDAVKNLGSRQRVEAESRPNQVLRAICEKADIRHVPYLSRSGAIKSPVCLPGKEVCLPNWAFDDMPEAEFKSLLAHELGHMVRRDPLMLMALQLLSRIFFFQPLFIIARKRLTDIAELAADEWAANQASDSRAVANALFTCATKIHETRQIQWGLAMAGNKSILKKRVERLIHAQSVPFKNAGIFAKTALGVGVIGLSLGLPSVEFAGAMTAESSMGNHPHVTDAPMTVTLPPLYNSPDAPQSVRTPPTVRTPGTPSPNPTPFAFVVPNSILTSPSGVKVSVDIAPSLSRSVSTATSTAIAAATAVHPHGNYHLVNDHNDSGNISWSDDDRRVSVNWEGDFRISDNDDFIEPEDEDGFVRIRTKEDGVKRSIKFEVKDGKRVADYRVSGDEKELDADGRKWLKSTINTLIDSGFGAEQRVSRILKKSKVKGVLNEVERLKSDFAKRIYLTELMDQAKLNDKDISTVVDHVGKFKSDFEKRLTLSELLEEENVSDKMLPKVLNVAKGLDSDFEKRLLVTHFVDEMKLTDKTTKMVIDIAETIESDFELRLLLTATLDETKLSDKNVQRIIDLAIKRIDSDFEKRLLLTALADEYDRSDAVIAKLLTAAKTIDSDFERRILLSTVVNEAKLSEKNWLFAIEVASDIDSNFEKSRALTHFRSEIPNKNKKVVAALDKAMEGMDKNVASNGNVIFEFDGDQEFFVLDENFALEFTSEYAEAMAELAEEIAELELEQVEMFREHDRNSNNHETREQVREHRRVLREKQREMRNVLRDQRNIEREIERAETQAVREIENQMRQVKRQMKSVSKGMERELEEVMRQLERSKIELKRQLDRRKVRDERRVIEEKKQKERIIEQKKRQADEHDEDTNI